MTGRHRNPVNKKPSGSQRRKLLALKRHDELSQRGSLLKHFNVNSATTSRQNEEVVEIKNKGVDINTTQGNVASQVLADDRDKDKLEHVRSDLATMSNAASRETNAACAADHPAVLSSGTDVDDHSTVDQSTSMLLSDIGTWPDVIHQTVLDHLVEIGPPAHPPSDFIFPIHDESGRSCNVGHFFRTMKNGERVDRDWLVYSIEKNALFCFACKLFGSACNICSKDSWPRNGTSDWKHVASKLSTHDKSHHHLEHATKFYGLKSRLESGSTIDKKVLSLYRQERKHWENVFDRLIACITFLAENNLPFRGVNCTIFSENNGVFLGLVKLIAKFDLVMQEHLRRIKTKEIHDHYLGPQIQNEIIDLIANKAREQILSVIKKCKYFSIILDCTPDASKQEQMTIILRVVIITNHEVEIREYFLGFIKVIETTGLGLTEETLKTLLRFKLDIQNCRGQGYDNGSNMKGKKSGVQRRILNINPKAFYTPCACHNLNLILGDIANCIPKCVTFFGILQNVYNVLSGSPQRWEILRGYVNITVKPLAETRWESRIECVIPIKYQLHGVCRALIEVSETTSDSGCKVLAKSLVENHLLTFEFIVSVHIWHDILNAINAVSKVLQDPSMCLDLAMSNLNGLIVYFTEYRQNGLAGAVASAREVAETVDVEPVFKPAEIRKKTRLFDYEGKDESVNLSPYDNFKINYFIPLLDHANQAIQDRLEQFQFFNDNFSFLYNVNKLKSLSEDDLLRHCKDLGLLLTSNVNGTECSDIDAIELYDELKFFRHTIPDDITNAKDVLILAIKTKTNPNTVIAYRIIFTMPITVASAERSFSTLKLIKTPHRSSMTQERLDNLAIISIENDVVDYLDSDDIRKSFANLKSRKHF